MSNKQSRGDVEDTTTRKAENELDTVVTFDYAALDAETRIVVQQRTGEIRKSMRKAVESIAEIGRGLIDVKAKLKHGEFGAWLEAEFGWTDRTARNFMMVAESFKTENFSDLNFAPSALYLLAKPSTPEHARRAAVALAESGQKVTHQVAKAIIDQHRPITYGKKEVSPFPAEPSVAPGEVAATVSGMPVKPTGRLPQPTPFVNTRVITPQHNGDTPAVAPDGRKPDNDPLSGTNNRTTGEAPVIPGRYQKRYMNGKDYIVDTQTSAVLDLEDLDAVVFLLNARPALTVIPASLPTLEAVAKELDIKTADMIELGSEHGCKVVTHIALAAQAANVESAYREIVTIVLRWQDIEKASPQKALFKAICDAFHYNSSKMTTQERTRVGKTAKSLHEVGATVDDIPLLYAFCEKQYTSFKDTALTTNWSDWKAERVTKKVEPVNPSFQRYEVPADDKEYISLTSPEALAITNGLVKALSAG